MAKLQLSVITIMLLCFMTTISSTSKNHEMAYKITQNTGLNPNQSEPIAGYTSLPVEDENRSETRMDWFDNLDQRDKDKVTQLLSQGIQHYNGLHQNVLMDMKTKFGLIPAQTQQLYRFLYSKENDEQKNDITEEEDEECFSSREEDITRTYCSYDEVFDAVKQLGLWLGATENDILFTAAKQPDIREKLINTAKYKPNVVSPDFFCCRVAKLLLNQDIMNDKWHKLYAMSKMPQLQSLNLKLQPSAQSGYFGVYEVRRKSLLDSKYFYISRVGLNGKQYYLGRFDSKFKAANCVNYFCIANGLDLLKENNCSKGHALEKATVEEEGYKCDFCDNSIGKGESIYSCDQCEHDLCYNCMKKNTKTIQNQSSKCTAVSWNKISKKWKTLSVDNKKQYYGGNFDNEAHAAMKINLLCDDYVAVAIRQEITNAKIIYDLQQVTQMFQKQSTDHQKESILWSIFNFDGQKTILSYLITNYDCEIHDMKKKKGEKTDIHELLIQSNGEELYITTTSYKSQKRKRKEIMNDAEEKVEIETPNWDENELFEKTRKD